MVRVMIAALAAFAVFDLYFQNGIYTSAALGNGVALVHRLVTGY